jgi:hypothetical protein
LRPNTLTRIAAGALLGAAFAAPATAQDPPADPPRLTVVVVVVDSLMPAEIGQSLPPTPNLSFLRDAGTFYAHSRAVFSAETIPNHVAMMTGVVPERSGIVANSYWNRTGEPAAADLSLPSELEATTLFTRLRESCPDLRTAAALSKSYLYEVFSECGYSGADCGINDAPHASFDPSMDPTFIPVSEHTPDITTMREARALLPGADFLFVNLGDVDRTGHVDETGATGTPIARYAALADTDTLVGQLVDDLDAAGRWDTTVMFIVSDHGMDWSTPDKLVNLAGTFEPGLFAVQNGGTADVYVVDPADPEADAKLAAARMTALMHEGVEAAWYREANAIDPGEDRLIPASLGARHENIGDLVILAKEGWRISEPGQTDNPLPGNHGHPATFHNTFLVTGGLLALRSQTVGDPAAVVDPLSRLSEQSENTDVAATVAWLFGIDGSDMDGRALTEAFTTGASPSTCGAVHDSDGDGTADYVDPCPTIAHASGCSCTATPRADCREPVRARAAKLQAKADGAAGDPAASMDLKFTWKKGAATTIGEFLDPADEALSLCLYSGDAATARQLGELRMPLDSLCGAATCWQQTSASRMEYTSPGGTADGVERARLDAGADGKARISVSALTSTVSMIPYDAPVRVQLQSRDGLCWGATFDASGIKRNDDTRFKAVSAAPGGMP